MAGYANPADLLCAWFPTVLATGPGEAFARWVTEFPTDVFAPGATPCVVVDRFGGADAVAGLDDANVDIDVYTAGPDPIQARSAALARAEDIRRVAHLKLPGARLTLPGPPPATATVARVRIISAPTIRPYDSRGIIRRAHLAIQVRLHQPLT